MRFPRRAPSRSSPRASVWLLAFGLLAMAMHAVAGMGVMPGRAADAGFVPELCTSHGLVKPGLPLPAEDTAHACCQLCAGGGPLLLPGLAAAVSPAPTFTARPLASGIAVPLPAPRRAPPPRGPPAPV